MPLTINFIKSQKTLTDTLIIPVFEGKKSITNASFLEAKLKKEINAVLKKQKQFSGKKSEFYVMPTPLHDSLSQIILVGLGKKPSNLTHDKAIAFEEIGGKLHALLRKHECTKATLAVSPLGVSGKNDEAEVAAHLAMGLKLRSYVFDTYKTDKELLKNNKKSIKVSVLTNAQALSNALYKGLNAAADGVFIARDLMNEPPNNLYPASFASKVRRDLKPLGVDIEIFDEKKMEKLGFHSHIEVGKGSARKPRVLIMRWNGLPKGKKADPISFIGKGVTFDTGGISLKPGPGMEDMKMDMGGAAAVVGVMKALATRKAKANVIGIVGLAENMPSSNAYRPGDVINTMDGKTVEVLNTDAEGRLVLIDALTYVQKKFKPTMMIDLATLTGAMMVALGTEYCGAFVNNDKLWDQLNEASENSGEKLWRMPLDQAYRDEVKSTIADLKNLGGRFGGACTAAAFLQHFVTDDKVAGEHLDIAGKMIHKTDSATAPAGGIGFGVRVLDKLVHDNYEK